MERKKKFEKNISKQTNKQVLCSNQGKTLFWVCLAIIAENKKKRERKKKFLARGIPTILENSFPHHD